MGGATVSRASWDPGGALGPIIFGKPRYYCCEKVGLTSLEVPRASSLEQIRLNKPDELKVRKL